MNFIKDRELSLRFKNNSVPSAERFLYYISTMTLATLFSTQTLVSLSYTGLVNNLDILFDATNILVIIAGTILCYRTNKSGDDREFIERMICIGFPVIIRSFLIFISASIFYYAFLYFVIGQETPDETSLYDFPPFIFLCLYYYWRLNSSIRIAAN